jgi:hypothetical protein
MKQQPVASKIYIERKARDGSDGCHYDQHQGESGDL